MSTDDEQMQRVADAVEEHLDRPQPRRWGASILGLGIPPDSIRTPITVHSIRRERGPESFHYDARAVGFDLARSPDFSTVNISNVGVTDDGAGFTLTAEAHEQLRQSVMQDLERVSANMGFRALEVREVHDSVISHVDFAGVEARVVAQVGHTPVPQVVVGEALPLNAEMFRAAREALERATRPASPSKVTFPTMLNVKCSGKIADKDTLMDAVEAALKAANIGVERSEHGALIVSSLDDRKYTEDVITDKVRRLDLE